MSSKSSSSLKFKFDDPNTEVKIVDGELWVKSSTTIMGYLNAEMQNFTTDGWFKTGDLVELDNEGYIYIKGRNNNIINVGGLKVFPQEVESVLMKLPFIENCIVYEFREWDHSGFYTPYVDQIKAAVTNGHDVQLHLHPHWLTSTFNGKEFKPSDDYSLTDFFVEKNGYNIEKIIEEGVGFFNETLTPVSSDYSCNAFRAGGYNLGDDHSRSTILKALHKHGIRYDSSIAKGQFFNSGLSEVDYRRMPSKCNWFLSLDGNLRAKNRNTILVDTLAPHQDIKQRNIPLFIKNNIVKDIALDFKIRGNQFFYIDSQPFFDQVISLAKVGKTIYSKEN